MVVSVGETFVVSEVGLTIVDVGLHVKLALAGTSPVNWVNPPGMMMFGFALAITFPLVNVET